MQATKDLWAIRDMQAIEDMSAIEEPEFIGAMLVRKREWTAGGACR